LWLYPPRKKIGRLEMDTTEKKPYARPVLVRREKLDRVTAVPITSGNPKN
jgi:hypothetical protein